MFERCAAEGWLGLKYPERYGGATGLVADAVWIEELSRCGSGGLAAGIGAHAGIATPPVWKFGTEEQKERWLAPAIRGEKIGALAITEPDAGSDVAARAHARASASTAAGSSTAPRRSSPTACGPTSTSPRSRRTAEGGHHGLTFLVIERGEGVSARPLEKLGWHASDTAELAFADVFVPDEHLLGEEGRGFHLIMANFQWERLVMALGAVGSMRATLERVIAFAAERRLGQAARHALAEQATRAEAGTAMTYHALRRFLDGGDAVREVTMAKLATQRASFELQDACLQLVMGAGVRDAGPRARRARLPSGPDRRRNATRSCARSSARGMGL